MSPSEREQRIVSLMPLGMKIARWLYRQLPRDVSRDDLEQVAMIGIIKAVDGFNPSLNVPITNYAGLRIRGELGDYLRQIDPLSRRYRTKISESGELPPRTVAESAAVAVGMPPDYGPVEARIDLERLMTAARLTARMRVVVSAGLADEPQRSVARRLEIHESRVSQLNCEALSKMRAAAM